MVGQFYISYDIRKKFKGYIGLFLICYVILLYGCVVNKRKFSSDFYYITFFMVMNIIL